MAPKVLYGNYKSPRLGTKTQPTTSMIRTPKRVWGSAGFTMVETIVAIAVLGIGVASTIGVLTKVNSFAA
ncbi:MAG TPA: prepilin-type N-terminal cleavage/methylation domain-containing protein, partial [Chthoniobacterales bacterium]